jgi:antitoxin (DNA-binding transcriptional repressor) of toxin-antitoxin stability system
LSEIDTFIYMSEIVDIPELQENLSFYLGRVSAGMQLVIIDRSRPIAELGPPSTTDSALDRLIAEGKVKPPKRRGPLPKPLKLPPGVDPEAGTRALEEVRGYR